MIGRKAELEKERAAAATSSSGSGGSSSGGSGGSGSGAACRRACDFVEAETRLASQALGRWARGHSLCLFFLFFVGSSPFHLQCLERWRWFGF